MEIKIIWDQKENCWLATAKDMPELKKQGNSIDLLMKRCRSKIAEYYDSNCISLPAKTTYVIEDPSEFLPIEEEDLF